MRPVLKIISDAEMGMVHDAAIHILERTGIRIGSEEVVGLLKAEGADVIRSQTAKRAVVRIPPSLIERAIATAPKEIRVPPRDKGAKACILGGDRVHFNPGSSAILIEGHETYGPRPPTSKDLRDFVVLADALEQMDMQSTALVVTDVPKEITDLYRLYIALKWSSKPVVTGTFFRDTVPIMTEMARAASDDGKAPCIIFDICPTSPLMWEDVACQNLLDCARLGATAEIVPAPQMGATAPVTIAGAAVQSTAETLAGIVISQTARKGAPVIFGGSPITFDMRHATPSLGAIESAMLGVALAQMGKRYGLPTHMYVGTSDAKVLDAQAGMESAQGIIMGTLAGINNISGPGMLNSEISQSLEKLVMDNEICAMARRLARGPSVDEKTLARDVIATLGIEGKDHLSHPLTLELFKKEVHYPSPVIDRRAANAWHADGAKDAAARSRERVARILKTHSPPLLDGDRARALDDIVRRALKDKGIGGHALPEGPQ